MTDRKIDAIDRLELDIVEAGVAAWDRNKVASKLSKMTSAWRAMTRLAIAAQDPKKQIETLIAFEEREDELRRRRRAELIASGENPDIVPLPRPPQ